MRTETQRVMYMAARVVELAQAIADYIASQTYSFTFNVERRMRIKSDLADTQTTNVFVYPMYDQGKQISVDTRDAFGRTYTVNVEIVNFIDDPNEQREIDDALLLAEELEESFENTDLAGFQMLGFGAETSASFLEAEQLQDRYVFHVVIPLVFITVE